MEWDRCLLSKEISGNITYDQRGRVNGTGSITMVSPVDTIAAPHCLSIRYESLKESLDVTSNPIIMFDFLGESFRSIGIEQYLVLLLPNLWKFYIERSYFNVFGRIKQSIEKK